MSPVDDTASRRFLRWSVRGALIAVVLAYVTAMGYLMAREVSLVFLPRQAMPAVPADLAGDLEQLSRPAAGSATGRLWVLRQRATPNAPWVLYLHGNGSTVADSVNIERYALLRGLGLQVVAPEYPGFGNLPGTPSEEGLVLAARDAYGWLRSQGVSPGRIVIYGWSLGSGVATALASEVEERAVMLEGAFTGVDDRAAELYPWMPVRLIIRTHFASRDRIAAIGSPLLLLHAEDDSVIPFAHGQRLLALAREPKTLVPLKGGHVHANRVDAQRYASAVRTFLATALGRDAIAPAH